jgi:hypothetical protein
MRSITSSLHFMSTIYSRIFQCPFEAASSLVASVGNKDQWKNNRSAVLNGNAIESEATRKSRIQDGVHCIKWPTQIMQIGKIFQGRYVWRGNVKVYFLFIEEVYEGTFIYILHILRSKMYQLSQFINICAYLKISILFRLL